MMTESSRNFGTTMRRVLCFLMKVQNINFGRRSCACERKRNTFLRQMLQCIFAQESFMKMIASVQGQGLPKERLQVKRGRTAKEQQEQISPNLERNIK